MCRYFQATETKTNKTTKKNSLAGGVPGKGLGEQRFVENIA